MSDPNQRDETTADDGTDQPSGDDLNTAAIDGGSEVNDEKPDDGAGAEAS